MKAFDVLIVGAGQAGIPLARKLTAEKKHVGIAERKHLGGSCVNFGCTPTKAVIASARVAHVARRAAEFGVGLPEPKIEFPAVLARARGIVEESKEGLAKGLAECGAEVLHGTARFTGRDGAVFLLDVNGQATRATQVVINVGSRTAVPKIDGLDQVPVLHSGNWLADDALPEHLVITGAGYIALEMAQFYRRMGSRVTVIGPGEQVAAGEDPDVAAAMQKVLGDEGITFHLGKRVGAVVRDGANGAGLRVSFGHDGTGETVVGSHLFLATGRQPNTDDLGLAAIGLPVAEHGFLAVDARLATAVPGVWAAGDVRGGPMFTHTAWDDHRILESQLLGDGSHTTTGRIVPYAIFTDPELGRVGLTETEARRQHGEQVKVATFQMAHNGKAAEEGETLGFIKLIADARTRRLLGAAVLAAEGAELVASYITLMNAGVTLDAICRGIYIHPTLSEAVQSAAAELKLKMG